MSHPSPQSSTPHGPLSSPYTATDPTLYSPVADRKSGMGHRPPMSAKAAGKQPVKNANDKPVNTKTFLPAPAVSSNVGFANELSEDDNGFVSRYMFISQLPDGTPAGMDRDHEFFIIQHQMKLYACFLNAVPFYDHGMYLRFDDLVDAAEGKDIFEQHEFTVDYITAYDFAKAKAQDVTSLNYHEGQIKLSIMIDPRPDQLAWEFSSEDLDYLTSAVRILAQSFGPVRRVTHVDSKHDQMVLVYRVEFTSIDASVRAVHSLRLDPIWDGNRQKAFSWCTFEPDLWKEEYAPASPGKPRTDIHGRIYGYRFAPIPQQIRTTGRHQQQQDYDMRNRVVRKRINDGSDVRTTVMLRNIPNKLDWMTLKNILDGACFGTFDFVYLRIDFKTGCNVGYAFVNFTDANGMLALLEHVEGRVWPGFHSDKTAEVSYATIQGREALVQKFRNSSVMQETPYCRPHLFFTIADAEMMGQLRSAGTEQAFPQPNNFTKLQRSMDSARTVGLYPPSGSQAATEHRNRTGTYDRGGPRDIMQAAVEYAHQRATPVQTAGLSEAKKRDIEIWYLCTYGGGGCGRIPFECIPLTHVTQYLQEHTASSSSSASVPGVIGQPAGGSSSRAVALNMLDDGTPTGTPTPTAATGRLAMHPFGVRDRVDGNANANPFL
ncbi:hypothetical protein yc1106_03036 [Curvularia clavata]|uniref:RRM domain-containing protein n=1 Tax=Curvularia clavata TaxID=95742 RepID=A0A9Q8Z3V6_CURCL|nr:hypothetical protein yc1106_03036 [Curvularia clavata]